MKRKAMFEGLGQAAPSPALRPASSAPAAMRFGAAMHDMQARAERMEELERTLAASERVVEIAPALIDPSPIRDRLPSTVEEDRSLRDSIAESGQTVPVLLRPSATPGRYVTVFGHRRVAAATELGRTVRAVVRAMPEEDALVAQGLENAERRDLTFIERARFALRLSQAGWTHAKIARALGTAKSSATVMIGVARDIPDEIVLAVGRAPRLGEPRWRDLAGAISAAADEAEPRWRQALLEDGFGADDEEGKRRRLMNALAPKPKRARNAVTLTDGAGQTFASAERRSGGKISLQIEADKDVSFRADAAGFGDWLLEQLPDLRARWRQGR
jgi:ParB family chromosome partitioning protein